MRHIASLLILLLLPPCFAGYAYEPCKYVVRLNTTIEGKVFDPETGEGVPASILGRIGSGSVEARAGDNGYFRFELPWADLEYDLGFSYLPGYENVSERGSIQRGGYKFLSIALRYDPFDLEFENSGEVRRPYSQQVYSWTTSEPFTATRQVFTGYREKRENRLKGYRWEERQVKESASREGRVIGYKYSYVEYRRNWHWGWRPGWGNWYYYGTGTEIKRSYRGSSFVDGGSFYQNWKRIYTFQAYVCEFWVWRGGPSPPSPTSDIRNLQMVYEVVSVQEPVYRTETYTAYHVYRVMHVTYSPQPWQPQKAALKVKPKNNYEGKVALEVLADNIKVTLESECLSGYQWVENGKVRTGSSPPSGVRARPLLSFHSPAVASLYLTPSAEGNFEVKLRAYDENGRLVEDRTYMLHAVDPKPIPTTQRIWVKDDTKPNEEKPTLVSTTEENRQLVLGEFKFKGIYDGGTAAPPYSVTRLYTIDPYTGKYVYDRNGDGVPDPLEPSFSEALKPKWR